MRRAVFLETILLLSLNVMKSAFIKIPEINWADSIDTLVLTSMNTRFLFIAQIAEV